MNIQKEKNIPSVITPRSSCSASSMEAYQKPPLEEEFRDLLIALMRVNVYVRKEGETALNDIIKDRMASEYMKNINDDNYKKSDDSSPWG